MIRRFVRNLTVDPASWGSKTMYFFLLTVVLAWSAMVNEPFLTAGVTTLFAVIRIAVVSGYLYRRTLYLATLRKVISGRLAPGNAPVKTPPARPDSTLLYLPPLLVSLASMPLNDYFDDYFGAEPLFLIGSVAAVFALILVEYLASLRRTYPSVHELELRMRGKGLPVAPAVHEPKIRLSMADRVSRRIDRRGLEEFLFEVLSYCLFALMLTILALFERTMYIPMVFVLVFYLVRYWQFGLLFEGLREFRERRREIETGVSDPCCLSGLVMPKFPRLGIELAMLPSALALSVHDPRLFWIGLFPVILILLHFAAFCLRPRPLILSR